MCRIIRLWLETLPELIAQADWIIDMGPEGGTNGGEVLCVGTPADIIKNPKSITGKFLK